MTTAASSSNKAAKIAELVQLRRQPNAGTRQDGYSQDYRRIEEFHYGFYDQHGWLSPWTVSACNVDSELMIIGQDWASEDFLSKEPNARMRALGHNPELATNRNLHRLLHESFGRRFENTFGTNAFVFAKAGGMNTRLPATDLALSAKRFALLEIEIVRPKMVICLGMGTFNGLRAALNCRPVRLQEIDYTGRALVHHGSEIHGVPHVGARGLSATGGYARSLAIWKILAARLDRSFLHSATSLRSEAIRTATMSDSSGA